MCRYHHKPVALAALQLLVQQWISAKQEESDDQVDLKQYQPSGESKRLEDVI